MPPPSALHIVFWGILYPHTAVAYEVTNEEDLLSFDNLDTPISETTRYVPLGHHAFFKCEAFERSSKMPERAKNASWWIMHRSGEKWSSYKLADNRSFERGRIIVIANTAYLYGMSTSLDGSIIGCSVSSEDQLSNDTISQKTSVTSRITLVAQNCGKNEEDSSTSMNKLNPCRFGSCHVRENDGFRLLECRCMPQYTGLYCDKLVSSATFYELFFYSPVAALISVLLFVACCFDYVEGMRKEKPMKLEKHLPRGSLAVDLKRNYPAMFLTPEQYAEMASAIHQEASLAASLKDRSRQPSAERTGKEAVTEKGHSALGAAPSSKKVPGDEIAEASKLNPKLLTPPSQKDSEKSLKKQAKKSAGK